MALYSENKNFIFFHLYKCGGMSLRHELNKPEYQSREVQDGHSLPIDMYSYFKELNKLDDYEKIFKFTFIRNPFDFMVSTYFYGKSYKNHFMHNDIINRNMDIEMFIPYYFEHREKDMKSKPRGSNKVVTFKDWLLDSEGNLLVDFIGKMENYDNDYKFICEKLGLPFNSVPLVNVNPNKEKDYRKYYNNKSIKMIENHFEWELNKFNYKF